MKNSRNTNTVIGSSRLNLILTMVLVFLLGACSGVTTRVADQAFVNGEIYTVDDKRSWAQAVAIRDGGIIFVGSNEGAKPYIGESTRVTDLTGKMMLPGFHDGHAHILDGGRSLNACNLQDSNDIDQIRELLIECRDTRHYGPDDWVIGTQWQLTAFGPSGPSRIMLDEIFAGRPAIFMDSFGHNIWVSTQALKLAGINAQTQNPAGGIIVRDPESAEATGTLRESAMNLVSNVVPPLTDGEKQANLSAGLAEAARYGITAFIEPGMQESDMQPYLAAQRNNTLSARVLASLSPQGISASAFDDEVFDLIEKRNSFRGEYLSADSVKVFMDGVIETYTSNMLEPYSDTGGNFAPFYDQATANTYYQKLDALGVQIHTHAIGDGAIHTALNAYEYALEQNGPNDNRHQIVHLQLIDDADIPRFAALNVTANFQSLWANQDQYYHLAIPLVGQQRADNFYSIKSVVDSGARVTGGSDWSVSSLNPLDAIEVAIRRQDPWTNDDPVHQASERVSLATMIDAYTRNGAWAMRLEGTSGSIEVGKRADLIILDRNLFELSPEDINTARVLLTLMDGREVYKAE
ncbi:MAG: amidohydrolase [Pseudomonadales bacterium]|jgi:predicted amidohydrolase YtcJ